MKTITLVITLLAAIVLFFWSTSSPSLSLQPDAGPIGGSRELAVKLDAPRWGLKRLTVAALQGGRRVELLTKNYPSGVKSVREPFTLAAAGLKDGLFTLQVEATGFALPHLRGRTAGKSLAFTYDATPPQVTVLSTAHNFIQGGAGLVIYTVSKEVERTGVMAGDRWYPGYRQGGNTYACLFPFPFDQEPQRYVPKVLAVDRAGNERLAGINYHLLANIFTTDDITLTDSFLEKIAADFKGRFPQAKTPLEIYLKVNGEQRDKDRKALADYGRKTSPVPLWQGNFLRMPNSAPLGGFAQTRSYFYRGQKVDQQTHLGFDLASVRLAPVPAANRGTVVFAADFGLYGLCVIIDHGLGLQTLYGHLSRIGVKVGESVERGQIIGNSGATGMAAGDHLHFGVVVSGQEVSPLEWWDASWVRNNVTGKLGLVKGPAAQ